jgi:hypothetical protein
MSYRSSVPAVATRCGSSPLDVIEPYRKRNFIDALYTFREDGRPCYNLVLTGRGKKNWKSADLILAAIYRLLAWESPQGNDCFLLANDEGQAGDDLKLAKKPIAANPLLDRGVIVKQKGNLVYPTKRDRS